MLAANSDAREAYDLTIGSISHFLVIIGHVPEAILLILSRA
jgi:hypothetical protein